MIKLSSLLEHILDHPMKSEVIQEAKRLERIDECSQLTHLEITPDVSNTELKPLLYGDGDGLYVVVDSCGHVSDCSYEREEMESFAERVASRTGKPHTVCQVMQPDSNGNCPTQCVYTPEREHEWVIFNPDYANDRLCWLSSYDDPTSKLWWCDDPLHFAERFPTYAEAEACIERLRAETSYITNAYPWPVPKLSEK